MGFKIGVSILDSLENTVRTSAGLCNLGQVESFEFGILILSQNQRLLQTGVTRVNANRRRQVDKVFHDVLEQEFHERGSFLDRVCADEPSLRKEVERLVTPKRRPLQLRNVDNNLPRSSAAHRTFPGVAQFFER
jgi:hypothetical protein